MLKQFRWWHQNEETVLFFDTDVCFSCPYLNHTKLLLHGSYVALLLEIRHEFPNIKGQRQNQILFQAIN